MDAAPDDTRPRPIPDCYWVRDGLLLAGEYPGHPRAAVARRRLRQFIAAGIRQFIDLTEDWELEPYAQLLPKIGARKRLDLAYARYPVADLGVPTPATMHRVLDALDAAVGARRPVYLHCWGGVGRTGTVVGCWLVRQGLTVEDALAQIDAWWQSVPKRSRHPQSPETAEQRRFIRCWPELETHRSARSGERA